jgi:uncharacterized protein YukE
MDNNQRINILEVKRISRNFIDYRKEISIIFNEYKRIIDNTKTYFIGEAGNEYRKKFTEFYNKLGIILESLTEFSESLNNIANEYTNTMELAAKNLEKDILKNIK